MYRLSTSSRYEGGIQETSHLQSLFLMFGLCIFPLISSDASRYNFCEESQAIGTNIDLF